MPNQMTAEICFDHSDDLSSATPTLINNGFEIERLEDWASRGGHVWIMASSMTELDKNGFVDWVNSIVDPHHGYVAVANIEGNDQLIGAAMAVCRIIIDKVKSGEIKRGHPGATRIVENLMWLIETGELPDFDVKASNDWNTPSSPPAA